MKKVLKGTFIAAGLISALSINSTQSMAEVSLPTLTTNVSIKGGKEGIKGRIDPKATYKIVIAKDLTLFNKNIPATSDMLPDAISQYPTELTGEDLLNDIDRLYRDGEIITSIKRVRGIK